AFDTLSSADRQIYPEDAGSAASGAGRRFPIQSSGNRQRAFSVGSSRSKRRNHSAALGKDRRSAKPASRTISERARATPKSYRRGCRSSPFERAPERARRRRERNGEVEG